MAASVPCCGDRRARRSRPRPGGGGGAGGRRGGEAARRRALSAPDGTGDTTDLRAGAEIHESLLALLPLVGEWHGTGSGVAPDGTTFGYGQTVRFAHDGRPFLAYESRAWLANEDGTLIRQAWRESGFWRPGAGPDDIEVVLASNTGQALVYAGVAGELRWELSTASARHTTTAKTVDAERRLYALVGEDLVYVTELAPGGDPLAPHLNGRLSRR